MKDCCSSPVVMFLFCFFSPEKVADCDTGLDNVNFTVHVTSALCNEVFYKMIKFTEYSKRCDD